MAISGGDGSIILSTKVDTSGINKGMTSIKSTISKIGVIIGTAFSVSAIVRFGNASLQLASDLQEVQNVVDVAFGNMSYKIEEFAKTSIENFGISELTAKRTASTYMAMAKGMGIVEDTASDMAITMTGLTADIASFYNISQERADVVLKSVYTGETEALKQLGIVMTEVNLEQFAMSKGITKSLSAMTQQEKTMLRYQFVLEQTKLAQGDFARTSDSWANQTRILSERWKELQRIFGEAIMMFGALMLPAINNLINGLTKVAEFAKFATSNIYEMFTGKKLNEEEQSSQQTADNIQDQVENQEQLNKEMKKTLAGFDDIQILSSKIAENTESSEGETLAGAITDTTETNQSTDISKYQEIAEATDISKYQEIAEAIKSTLADILQSAGKALMAVGLIVLFSGNVIGGIGLIMAGATAYMAGDVIGSENPIQTLKNYLTELEQYITPALLSIGVLLLFFGHIPLGIGLIMAGIVHWGYKEVQSKEYDTMSFEDKLNTIMEAVSLGLVGIGVLLIFFGQIPLGIGMIIAGKHLLNATEAKLEENGVVTKIKKFLIDVQNLVVGVSLSMLAIGLILVASGNINKISLGLLVAGASAISVTSEMSGQSVSAMIKQFFDENVALIVGVSTSLVIIGILLCLSGIITPLSIGLIVAGASALTTEVTLNGNYVGEVITKFFRDNALLIAGVSSALLVLGVILVCSGVGIALGIGLIVAGASGLATIDVLNWDLIVDKIKGVWENIKNFWNTYIAPIFTAEWWGNLARKAMNGLISGFESGINGIIGMFEEMINWIVEGLNSLSFDIPEWVPGVGGASFGFNIPYANFGRVSIPRLAQGAVLPPNQPFLAMVGDQKHGTNIEAPLQTIVDAFNIALQGNANYGGGNTEVVLEIDGREFGRAVIEQGNRENRRIGTRLVTV